MVYNTYHNVGMLCVEVGTYHSERYDVSYVPQCRYDVHRAVLGSSVGDGDPDEDVVGGGLGVLGRHVPVPVLVERSCSHTQKHNVTYIYVTLDGGRT